jgi:adenine-specific DNA-methyltransferase
MVSPESRMRHRLSWDPFSPEAWAAQLGLVHIPLFGVAVPPPVPGNHAVLLDGAQGSFIVTAGDEPELPNQAIGWTWSANMRHAVVIRQAERRIYIGRWDMRNPEGPFNIPDTGEDAERLFQRLQDDRRIARGSVISWVMQGFRHIRRIVQDPTAALLALNSLLLVAREVALRKIADSEVRAARTFQEAINLLPEDILSSVGLNDRAQTSLDYPMASVGTYFLDQDPVTGHCLRADLLFRHAASDLYQEAHLELERTQQGYLFPLDNLRTPDIRSGPPDVRITPTNLARALAEQAVQRHGTTADELVVLDPACGSGIFLQEVARELTSRNTDGLKRLQLLGFDISPIARVVSESCLHLAKIDLKPEFGMTWAVKQVDALDADWPACDLILMNPPFRTWRDMTESEREKVRRCLGDHLRGRPDIAQAFLWKAVQSLRPGGCLAAVLPAALLDSQGGQPLREAIVHEADLLFIGRFEGFSYFSSSLVETSFIVLQRRIERPAPVVDVLIAAEGLEDAALRALRDAPAPPEVELFQIAASDLSARSWIPRRKEDVALLRLLDQRRLPSCGELFAIHQGIRTGDNEAFVLSFDEWSRLPAKERGFFRKAAGQGTIVNGRLIESEFVFYPYAPNGVIFENEQELQRKVRRYYERRLEPRAQILKKRAGVSEWWLPTRPREWQYERSAKLVSTYFGKPGSFAYDADGDYVVLQGFAWFWKNTALTVSDEERTFSETVYPFAYLALLNSDVFEKVLSCYSWRMQGGQFNLEAKFLSSVPLPDLTDDAVVARSAVERLASLGRSIHGGRLQDVRNDINRATISVYQVPISL